ncbi:DUF1987 domain-containing protein [Sulfurimonas sp. SAG-AH-194-I05]|nr:DUF1987 domain-containing protein [Sulfurimonas sp. SAG-AH-194-I05]MDF1874522.1 DUF1987 domain-containing protein [Sulfurimonas sp. SAG-AH-194-I05]
MENLKIEATKYTPEIDFDVVNGALNITGKSYPENTFEYYKPIVEWIKEYMTVIDNDRKITVNLDLEYLNSSSLKAYFDLFDILEASHNNGKNILINWIFDEENDIAEETGEDFIEDFTSLNIKLVVKD